jgi:hypothetical protein
VNSQDSVDRAEPPVGPGGVPASAFGSPISDLIAADPGPRIKSVTSDLLDQRFDVPRVHRTRQEVWVEEPGTFAGGHWEVVGEV